MGIWSLLGLQCSMETRASVDESFRNMVGTFASDMVAAHTSAVIEYRIKRCGDWHVVIANKSCNLRQGRAPKPDLRLTTDHNSWLAIAKGLETGESLYMKRKLRAKGDQNLLMQLPQFFSAEPPKPDLPSD